MSKKTVTKKRGSITRRGPDRGPDTKWQVRVYTGTDADTGKRVYEAKTVQGTRQDAQNLCDAMVARSNTRKAISGKSEIKMKDVIQKWLAARYLDVESGRSKQATYDRYVTQARHQLTPYFGKMKIVTITKEKVLRTLQKMGEEQNLAKTTMETIHGRLSGVFKFAIEAGYIDTNPAVGIRGVAITGNSQASEDLTLDKARRLNAQHEQAKQYVLDEKQQAEFRNAIQGTLQRVLWTLMLHTGMRIGEACGLTWADVYDDHVDINCTLQRVSKENGERGEKRVTTDPKSPSSMRQVPISPAIREILRQHKVAEAKRQLASSHWEGPQFLFHTETGCVVDRCTGGKALKEVFEAMELYEFGGRTHVLRHTHATYSLWNAPRCLTALAERLGHKDAGITLAIYSHAMPEGRKALVDISDELVFGKAS